MKPIVETQDLSKRYGSIEVVKEVNLSIQKGSICAFLGQNGAGKSTTLRMLMGMIRPSSGSGTIMGWDISDEQQSIQIREKTAFVAEDKHLYDYMTVEQILRFSKFFFPLWRKDLEERLISVFELPKAKKIKKLSKGMRTKLALTLALSRGCELLILDEPTEGLDPLATENLLEFIVQLSGEGTSVFFSSHQIAEVEQIADHVCMIHKGQLVLDTGMDHIHDDYKYVRLAFDNHELPAHFSPGGALAIEKDGSTISFITDQDTNRMLRNAGIWNISSIDEEAVTLKDIFLALVKNK